MKLGKDQRNFLSGLLQRGSWDDECDWFYRGPHKRKIVCKALQGKGLIDVSWETDKEVIRLTATGKRVAEGLDVEVNR